MSKKPLAILLAITGNLSFAAGCLLQSLHRHSPELRADILLYTDGSVEAHDATLLQDLGARLLPFYPKWTARFDERYVRRFTLLALARFEAFQLARLYETVLYLDVDIAVQDDIAPLLSAGPLGVTYEDPHSFVEQLPNKAGINILKPIPGFDIHAHNVNSGIFVVQNSLLEADGGLYASCGKWLERYAEHFSFPDQGLLNLLVHRLLRNNVNLVRFLPYGRFNAHPCNPEASQAMLVHTFGMNKVWNDALMQLFFPEWARDYKRWTDKGGTPYRGRVLNAEVASGGFCAMLHRLFQGPDNNGSR